MRNLLILTLLAAITMVFGYSCSVANADAIDADYYAKIWDKASHQQYDETLDTMFDAIAIKKETKYEQALTRFISYDRLTARHRAIAIATVYRLGFQNSTAIDFNNLLKDDVLFEAELWPSQCREKSIALGLMKELGIKLESEAAAVILADSRKTVELGFPQFGLEMLGWMRELGHDIPKADAEYIRDKISLSPRKLNGEDLKRTGIKPNWQVMFSEQYKKEPKALRQWNKICELMFAVADKEDLEEYVKLGEDNENLPETVKYHIEIVKVCLGGEMTSKELADFRYGLFFHYSQPLTHLLPDSVLMDMFEYLKSAERKPEQKDLLAELVKRGKKDEVDKYLDSLIEEVKTKLVAQDSGDGLHEQLFVLLAVAQFDTTRYMDILSELLNESPHKNMIASHMLESHLFNRMGYTVPELDEWILANPEKLAQAIEIVLNTFTVPPAEAKRNEEVGLSSNYDQHNKSLAYAMMMYLPREVFLEHFKEIDVEIMTTNAYLTGTYFQVNWPLIKNQDEFYRRFSEE